MPLAREALPYLGVGAAVGTGGIALGFPWIGGCALGLAAFVAFFFRDPERSIPAVPGVVVSPADGRVTEVAVPATGQGIRISIFLSILDVHVNRSPVAGRIRRVRYRPGRFLPANLARAGAENERNDVWVDSEMGSIRFSQIAGIIARRIVFRKQEGDRVEAGERVGLIQFGSRVEVELPPGTTPSVAVGARVQGGSTVLAHHPAVGATREGGVLAQANGK